MIIKHLKNRVDYWIKDRDDFFTHIKNNPLLVTIYPMWKEVALNKAFKELREHECLMNRD